LIELYVGLFSPANPLLSPCVPQAPSFAPFCFSTLQVACIQRVK
jgi:hypothetical protein